jgi:hypothetical protein
VAVGPIKPVWTSASFLLYFGGFLVLGAVMWLLGVLEDDHGAALFSLLAAVVLGMAGAAAYALRARDRDVAAGIFAVITAVVFGVFLASLLDLVGLLDEDGGFNIGRLLVELGVLVAALVLIARFRFPLLVLVAAAAGYALVADTLTDGGDWLAILSLVIGLAYAGIGSAVDRAYGMWMHLAAGALVLGGLLNFFKDGDFDWILILIVGLVYVGIADAIDRSSYAVLGALVILASSTRFIEEWWGLPDPLGFVFGGEQPDVDDLGRPLAYMGVGLFFVALGLLLETRRRLRARLEAEPAP